MDYKKTNAPTNTVTRDMVALSSDTGNIYETVCIIAKRANQIAVEMKTDLEKKLQEFASCNDNLEEVFENREQIEISRYYEKLPKPVLIATQEYIEGKVYYKNPEKTAEAFVQNPLNNCYPERVYKTGDIVKYNDFGELIYISRKDFQIKRMGYRIELGEIEAGANSVDKVKACACIYDKGADCLALVYEGKVKDPSIIFEAVKNKVPSYMMPDRFLRIKEMPKNANGKIDRKALQTIYKDLM